MKRSCLTLLRRSFVAGSLLTYSFGAFAADPSPSAQSPQLVQGGAMSTGGQTASGAPAWTQIILLVGIVLFMWLFVFRPQSKRAKEQKTFLASLTPGIEVITAGGMIGTVVEVRENIVSLNVGNSTVRVLKSSISGKLESTTSPQN